MYILKLLYESGIVHFCKTDHSSVLFSCLIHAGCCGTVYHALWYGSVWTFSSVIMYEVVHLNNKFSVSINVPVGCGG